MLVKEPLGRTHTFFAVRGKSTHVLWQRDFARCIGDENDTESGFLKISRDTPLGFHIGMGGWDKMKFRSLDNKQARTNNFNMSHQIKHGHEIRRVQSDEVCETEHGTKLFVENIAQKVLHHF